jgi:hypothetical protein
LVRVGQGDTVFIHDAALGRITVLSPELAEVRTMLVGYAQEFLVQRNGHVVINAPRYDRELAGLAIHELDEEGRHVRSFDEYASAPTKPARSFRFLTSTDTSVWSVKLANEYVITKWDAQGERVVELHRNADWFPPYADMELATPEHPRSPTIEGIWVDDQGLVWTLGVIPGSEWRSAFGDPVRREGRLVYPVADIEKALDVMIEVIDPVAGVLVASRRVQTPLQRVVEPGLIARSRETENGFYVVDLHRVTLVRPEH